MVNPNEDTEFNDALRAHGILPPKPPSRSPSPDIPHITHADAVQAIAATADTAQLDLLLEGDNLDSDDEAMFNEYRAKRMAMMRKEEKRGRFGTMEPLAREDFVREVTEGSRSVAPGDEEDGEGERDVLKKYAEGSGSEDERQEEQGKRKKGDGLFRKDGKLRGTGVVVFLFKDSVPLSQHLRPLLVRLAAAHPASKFLSIPAGLCIPNYPDKNVPTLLVYRNGEMLGQVVAGMGLNGMRTTVKDLEMLLLKYGALEKPSAALRERRASDAEDDNDEADDDGRGDTTGMANFRSGSGIRTGGAAARGQAKLGRGGESDDSDFDM